mmetsp:Transcript_107797/g.322410  ORF Transcript_107797/g.322410 Transcript_107797/m.322410 type:complete len:214 (+) Transcript_107797:135-776(+)
MRKTMAACAPAVADTMTAALSTNSWNSLLNALPALLAAKSSAKSKPAKKNGRGNRQAIEVSNSARFLSSSCNSRASFGNWTTSQSSSSSCPGFLSSGLSVRATFILRYSSTVYAHPTTAATAKKTSRRLSAARRGGLILSSGMKSPIFSLKSFNVTHAAAKMAVRPTPKGRKALRVSAAARMLSCWQARATACPELCRARPRDLVPELSPPAV